MKEPEEHELSPMAAAMQWTSRITTVTLEMILPGIGGQWLDERWGTTFIGLLGFVFGVTLGIWHLIQMTKIPDAKNEKEGTDKEGVEKES